MEPNEKTQSREDILVELVKIDQAITAMFEETPAEKIFAKHGPKWSPAENLEHLIRSIVPFTKGLQMPKTVLKLSFGKAANPSRSYVEIVKTYKAALEKGVEARGRYLPDSGSSAFDDSAKNELVQSWKSAEEEMGKMIAKWSETDLDKYRLPHPVLGKLTVREMLFFMLYHNFHHKLAIDARLEEMNATKS